VDCSTTKEEEEEEEEEEEGLPSTFFQFTIY
jgi:hypothetical protein